MYSGRGLETDCLFYKKMGEEKEKNRICLIVGAPTKAFRPSKGIMEFLDELSGKALRGKRGATFDTQIKMPLSGNAKGIEKRLIDLGVQPSDHI